MKIYTKTGDLGETSLYGGKRVAKHNQAVASYGTCDELNSAIGVLVSHLKKSDQLKDFLTSVQNDLFIIGAHLSGSKQDLTIIGKKVSYIEKFIDRLDQDLPPLRNFILPTGSIEASFAHLARAICRRAEREVVRLSKDYGDVDPKVIIYLNRLSDLLFITARFLNKQKNFNDQIWKKI